MPAKSTWWESPWVGVVVCVVAVVAVVCFLRWVTGGSDTTTYDEEGFGGGSELVDGKFQSSPVRKELASHYSVSNLEGDDQINQKCHMREEVRRLQDRMLNSTDFQLLMPNERGAEIDPTKDVPQYAIAFLWNSAASQSNGAAATVSATLRIHVFYSYLLGGQPYVDIKTMDDVDVRVTGTTPFYVPVPCDVIDRKRAASARIVRLLIEYADPAEAKCYLGIEKVAVVQYDGKDPDSDAQKKTTANDRGTRIRYGLLQVDPVVLVSNQAVATCSNQFDLPNTSAILGDVLYGGYRRPYTPNTTRSYRMRARFTGEAVPETMHLTFVQVDAFQAGQSENVDQGQLRRTLSELLESKFANLLSLSDPVAANLEQHTLRRENVTDIPLTGVKSDVLVEFAFACTAPRLTLGSQIDNLLLVPKGATLASLELLPTYVDATEASEAIPIAFAVQPFGEINDTSSYKVDVDDDALYTPVGLLPPISADYLVDADASIVRFRQEPGETPLDCKYTYSPPLRVNDGWMYTGTLRTPLVHPMASASKLVTMKVMTTGSHTFEFELTRSGAYLRLDNHPVANAPLHLTANVVRWTVFVYRNKFGFSLNLGAPVTGVSQALHMLHMGNTVSVASTPKEAQMVKKQQVQEACYPSVQEITIRVDPHAALDSRFVSAIGYAPSPVDMHLRRDDTRAILDTRPVYAWYADIPLSNEDLKQVDLSRQVTDSVSWQLNLTGKRLKDQLKQLYDAAEKAQVATRTGKLPPSVMRDVYTHRPTADDGNGTPALPELILLRMKAGAGTEDSVVIVTVLLQSLAERGSQPTKFNLIVRFDGCQQSRRSVRAATYQLGTHMMFQSPMSSLRGDGDERVVMLKYTLHGRRSRLCAFTKDDGEMPKLKESHTHYLNPEFDLKGQLKEFPQFGYRQDLVKSFVCADRASSTLCNPYTKPPTQSTCTLTAPVGSDVLGNPSRRITDFPCTGTVKRALDNRYTDKKCAQTTNGMKAVDEEACMKAAERHAPDSTASFANTSGDCNNCHFGQGSCKLVSSEKDEVSTHTYTTYRNCDRVDEMWERLGDVK